MTLDADHLITDHGLFKEPLARPDEIDIDAAIDAAFGPLPAFYADLIIGGRPSPEYLDMDARR